MICIYEQLWVLLDVMLAGVFAAMVGIEREMLSKPAGLRTHIIVGLASCLLVSLGHFIVESFYQEQFESVLRFDPFRIIEAIVLGISFIGAGTIIKSPQDMQVRFLTTAASVLLTAGIGISFGLKQYTIGIGVALLTLFVNIALRLLEKKLSKH